MNQVIDRFIPQNFDEVEKVKKALRECKDEWLEKKPSQGNVTYMSHNTMRQILDNAVKGITYWEFGVTEQWKEEIYAFNKNNNQYYFDGYVYHVKGYMFIPGIGRREQYGSKAAVGGRTNQDSAYKAAASNCFTKCASMFGVGAEIYDKIKVQDDEPVQDMNQQGFQQNFNPNQQQNQAFNQQQQYQQPNQGNWGMNQNNQDPNQQFQGFGGQNGNFNTGQQQLNQNPVAGQSLEQTFQEVDHMMENNIPIETPFTNIEPKQEATVNDFKAEKVDTEIPKVEKKQEEDVMNPWQEAGVIHDLQDYAAHKKRLNASSDDEMISYLRDYFKDEKATFESLKPENLNEFNKYLNSISV